MNDGLHELIKLMEQARCDGRELNELLQKPAVRHLDVALCHESCANLRPLAEVFQCDESVLAAAILRYALRDMQLHLTDDLDVLAAQAKALLDSPCQAASEAI